MAIIFSRNPADKNVQRQSSFDPTPPRAPSRGMFNCPNRPREGSLRGWGGKWVGWAPSRNVVACEVEERASNSQSERLNLGRAHKAKQKTHLAGSPQCSRILVDARGGDRAGTAGANLVPLHVQRYKLNSFGVK